MFLLLAFISAVTGLRGDPRNEFYEHDVVRPTLYQSALARSDPVLPKDEDEEITKLKFQAFDKNFVVDLKENKNLFSPNYKIILEKDAEDVIYKPSDMEKSCYYKGHMPNVKGSWAAISTCDGISGAVSDGNEIYYIEPDRISRRVNHFVFKASDYKQQNLRCGVEDSAFSMMGNKLQAKNLKGLYRSDDEPLYMEIVVICDNNMYKKYNGNTTLVTDRVGAIINSASALLSEINVFPTLQTTRIWMLEDRFEVSKDAQKTIDNFIKFRTDSLIKHEPHDNAILIAGERYDSGVTGNAYIGAVCGDRSAENIVDLDDSIALVGVNAAHEIGHNLGAHHDDNGARCKCEEENCVMYPWLNQPPAKHWSSCSKETFAGYRASEKYNCLKNKPAKLKSPSVNS